MKETVYCARCGEGAFFVIESLCVDCHVLVKDMKRFHAMKKFDKVNKIGEFAEGI